MSFRVRISILSVILVVLVGTYVVGTVFSPQARRARQANQPLLADFDPEDVGEIALISREDPAGSAGGEDQTPSSRVTLRRESAGNWAVEIDGSLYPARSSRVSSFLESLGDLRTLRRVTDNPELYGDFAIGEERADRLVLSAPDGSLLASAYFGKAAVQGNRVYARAGDDGSVYMTQGSVDFYFGEEPEYWAELAVMPRSLTASAVERISIQADIDLGDPDGEASPATASGSASSGESGPGRRVARFTVLRGENENWQFAEGFAPPENAEIDQGAINRWASTIVDYEGSSFADGSESFGLENPGMSLILETDTGREYRLLVGARAGSERFYLRGEGPDVLADFAGEPYVLTGSAFSVRRLFKAPDELFSVPEAP